MIDVILITLQDESNLDIVLQDLVSQTPKIISEIIVVDGGSTFDVDALVSKYEVTLLKAELGMLRQTLEGLRHSSSQTIMLAEADHRYSPQTVSDAYNEFKESAYDVLALPIVYRRSNGFFEKGHRSFMEIHYSVKGATSIASGTQFWKREKLKELLETMNTGDSFAFDTERSEVAEKIHLRMGIGETLVIEDYPIDFRKFISRLRNYGHGDFEFYNFHSFEWSKRRKLKSIFHIANRYFKNYPIRSIKLKTWKGAIPYLYLVGIFRYWFWIQKLFESRLKKKK